MLYELVLTQSYFNQEVINRWNFVSTSTPSSVTLSFGLVSAFGGIPDSVTHAFPDGSLMKLMADCQNPSLTYVSILAKAIYDPTDFYTTPFPVGQAGLRAGGAPDTPFAAMGFRSNQVRLDIKSGQKRLCGLRNDDITAGGVLSGTLQGLMQLVADAMSAPINYVDEGATLTYTPCVVEKFMYTAPPKKKAYRYYPTLAEQVPGHVAMNPIWSIKTQVRSQTSRQYGKGK